MRASQVLQKCLGRSLQPMHEARSRVLLRSVEALLTGRRLTLMDIARAWPGAKNANSFTVIWRAGCCVANDRSS